jgi:cell division topological specificity factor
MNLFNWFGRGSAPIARERLQILLAHERNERDQPDLLGVLREEILALINRHIAFDPDKVQIKMDRGKSVSTLAVDIEIPNSFGAPGEAPRQRRPRAKRLRAEGTRTMNHRLV